MAADFSHGITEGVAKPRSERSSLLAHSAPSPAHAAGPAGDLILLQRTVGNKAVASVLAGNASSQTLQRAARPGVRDIARPASGINKIGFVDSSDGANVRSAPAESGGQILTDEPLPATTKVFVSGVHPAAGQWWYVTAFLSQGMVRGYVQYFRINTELPEATAKLYQVKQGDSAEKLAVQEFSSAVRAGHDLRYYENVLLYVNQGRDGIKGTYQSPGLLGGGVNNIQLEAGRRIWLVSPAYARALESVVPRGSMTGGVYGKVKNFAQHINDILASVYRAPDQLDDVAGDYAAVLRDHVVEIVGVIAAFVAAEALSAFLAATPTGVGQLAAVIIQLTLAAVGVAGMVAASVQALQHAEKWLLLAWAAKGEDARIHAASREFVEMLVSIAMAALAYAGVRGNVGRALSIAEKLPALGVRSAATGARGARTAAADGAAPANGMKAGAAPGRDVRKGQSLSEVFGDEYDFTKTDAMTHPEAHGNIVLLRRLALESLEDAGPNQPVKVVPLHYEPAGSVNGDFTQAKFVAGRTPKELAKLLGVREFEKGVRVYRLDRASITEQNLRLRGYTQSPAGKSPTLQTIKNLEEYPPGLGAPQWNVATEMPVTSAMDVLPGERAKL
jgi:hypothetical protein